MTQKTLSGTDLEEEEAATVASLKKALERTEYILKTYPSTTGNDNLLKWRFYKIFEPDKIKISFKTFEKFLTATSSETITRCRRKLNEKGLYLPTEKTILKRRRRENIIRQNIKEL
jgi:hypothetical protein